MKIIGTSDDHVVLEATKNEVSNLIGWYSKYSAPIEWKKGTEINIHAMYQQLYQLASIDNRREEVAKRLREMAAELGPILPFTITAPTEGK